VTVDLNANGAGMQSVSGGHADGDVVSGFENVYGSDFDDVLTGNAEDNVLFGYAGVDVIDGGAGDDVVRGGEGADILTGGAGEDWLRYLGSDSGVTVDLTLDAAGFHQTSGGDAEGDTASGFENIYGSDFGDVLAGDSDVNYIIGYGGDDIIDGGAGNDLIRGGAGADTLIGGAGIDNLLYEGSDAGVTVDLSLDGVGQVSAGDASGDIISGFENVNGSEFGDTLTGNEERNFLFGLEGDDTISGGGGNDVIRGGTGADTLVGGAGSDLLQYAGSTAGVSINLNVDAAGFQQASGGDAQGDIISEFENVYSSDFGDVLVGNASRNILYSYDGNDIVDGGAGNDALRGGAGEDTFVFSTTLGAGNVDSISDFNSADDTFQLNASVFAGLDAGALDASEFLSNETGIAETADQRIIYDNATGSVYFDSDGTGAADGVLFATLSAGLSIDENDFIIV
jgi:Ca2+-binding RTX toxin-like protein